MKRLVSLAIIFMVAAMFWVYTASAKTVRIKKEQGGTLGHVAVGCAHRVTDWRTLKRINPKLPAPVEIQSGVYDVRVFQDDPVEVPDDWDCSKLDPRLGVVEPEPTPKEAPSSEGTGKAAPKKTPAIITPLPNAGGGSLWVMPDWLLGLLIILAVLLLIFLLTGGLRFLPLIILGRRRNPARYPAMVPGGLSDDPTTALAQIAAAYPGRTVATRRIVRGHFVKADNSVSDMVKVGMAFRDGVDRPVYLFTGDPVYQALLEDGTVEGYYLQACGNAISRLQKPNGWRFVVGQAVNIPQPIPPVPPTPPVPIQPTTATAPAPEPKPEPEPEPAPAEPSAPAEEPAVTVAEGEHVEHTLTSNNEIEVTVDGFLVMVVGKNGNIPATEIRTGGGVKVTIQKP